MPETILDFDRWLEHQVATQATWQQADVDRIVAHIKRVEQTALAIARGRR